MPVNWDTMALIMTSLKLSFALSTIPRHRTRFVEIKKENTITNPLLREYAGDHAESATNAESVTTAWRLHDIE